MIRFVAGFAIPWVVLLAWALAAPMFAGPTWMDARTVQGLVLKLLVVPATTAWLTLDAVRWLRRPAWLDPRSMVRLRTLFVGAGAGIVASALAASAFGFLRQASPDAVVIIAACFVSTSLAALALRRFAPWRCVACGYDLRGATGVRCPECGSAWSAARFVQD